MYFSFRFQFGNLFKETRPAITQLCNFLACSNWCMLVVLKTFRAIVSLTISALKTFSHAIIRCLHIAVIFALRHMLLLEVIWALSYLFHGLRLILHWVVVLWILWIVISHLLLKTYKKHIVKASLTLHFYLNNILI